MIDWFGVFAAALWIAGLALLLALLGLARSVPDRSLRQALAQPEFRAAVAGGIALFAIGLGLTVGDWFERIGWFVVVLLALWEGVSALTARARR